MPNNDIRVSWIKLWIPPKNLYFNALFLLCLECHLRTTVENAPKHAFYLAGACPKCHAVNNCACSVSFTKMS